MHLFGTFCRETGRQVDCLKAIQDVHSHHVLQEKEHCHSCKAQKAASVVCKCVCYPEISLDTSASRSGSDTTVKADHSRIRQCL